MVAAVHESIGDLLPWMPWARPDYAAADAAAWVQSTRAAHGTGSMYDFAIVDGDGRYAGGCGINQINAAAAVANLGYWVRSSSAGRGIAVSAVRTLVDWTFAHTPLNRLEIVVAEGNRRSQRVAEKAGAHRDALLRSRLLIQGRPSDAVLFSVVRGDWPPSPSGVSAGA
jgi:RimJ/RimL family protein N-acetyltransferase